MGTKVRTLLVDRSVMQGLHLHKEGLNYPYIKQKRVRKTNDLELSSAGEVAGTTDSWGALRGRHVALPFQNYTRLAGKRSMPAAGCVEGAIQLPTGARVEVTLLEVLTHVD